MKKEETIQKSICVINRGCVSSRELYLPNCEVTLMVSELWRGPRKRTNFLFEDLLTFVNHGWKVYYMGKKSSKLHLINAEYLGEMETEATEEAKD